MLDDRCQTEELYVHRLRHVSAAHAIAAVMITIACMAWICSVHALLPPGRGELGWTAYFAIGTGVACIVSCLFAVRNGRLARQAMGFRPARQPLIQTAGSAMLPSVY